MAATAKEVEPVAPAPQPIVIQPLDDIARYVHANAGLDLDTMPGGYEETGRYELPVVDPAKRRKISLGGDREKEVPVDIGWANRNKFVYAWLSPTTQSPQFSGYRTVTKDCPAAFAGGKPIPDSYFGGKGYIAVGDCVLHFAKASFAQGVKETTRAKALRKLDGFKPGARSVDVGDGSGNTAGGVVTKSFDHQGFEEG